MGNSNYISVREKLAVKDEMMVVFQRAAESRSERQEVVEDVVEPWPGREPGWALYERQQLHTAVNVERACRYLESVPESVIKRVERMACGHSDYAEKYTLYCAELAVGMG